MMATATTRVVAPVELVPRELDLSAYGHDAFVDRLNIVPGLRTSTGKFKPLGRPSFKPPSSLAVSKPARLSSRT